MQLKEVGSVEMCEMPQTGEATIYFFNPKRRMHNTDGPAFIASTGYKQWWVNGVWVKDNYEEVYP